MDELEIFEALTLTAIPAVRFGAPEVVAFR